MKEERRNWRESREGAHLLPPTWKLKRPKSYGSNICSMQLTEAKASFRALKSELSIRPLFNQQEPRAKAHVMVAFLDYAMWVTLKHIEAHAQAPACPGPRPSPSGVDDAQPFSTMI